MYCTVLQGGKKLIEVRRRFEGMLHIKIKLNATLGGREIGPSSGHVTGEKK